MVFYTTKMWRENVENNISKSKEIISRFTLKKLKKKIKK